MCCEQALTPTMQGQMTGGGGSNVLHTMPKQFSRATSSAGGGGAITADLQRSVAHRRSSRDKTSARY